jgi:hypothetical protein
VFGRKTGVITGPINSHQYSIDVKRAHIEARLTFCAAATAQDGIGRSG